MFLFVMLKAFQQKNVAFDHYWPVVPISLAMAATEVYVIASVALLGYNLELVLSIGCGAGCGAITGMLIHKRVFRQQVKK